MMSDVTDRDAMPGFAGAFRKSLSSKLAADADKNFAIELLNESQKSTPSAVAPTAYFTDGELLPWKGQWFRVQLREINGEKLLTLVRRGPTESSQKRATREARWLKQHPRSDRAQRARFIQAAHGRLLEQSRSQPALRS